jgi:hypothetical protein
MVRSPKLIAGSVGLALGNAPYKISDRSIDYAEIFRISRSKAC